MNGSSYTAPLPPSDLPPGLAPSAPTKKSYSTDLPARSPTHVIHQPPYLPARGISQREHGTYEPTSLVSPPSPDPSKASLSVKNNTPESKEQQHFRLARPTRRQAKPFQTAWRYSLAARRQRPPRPTVFSSPPGTPDAYPTAWRTYPCCQALYQ
ncbi:hypothetical protein DEO72_LG7g1134 [Vigna unguiculata]|uniref:Uncharacterized protein n=1 Tax=Vigna unguiculata TaxID=3917 RepID=A0A4D6MHZ1_VIGUN|nr:hypothetical protein DEO72_LG7g1134 [Vigna unguiculata]